MFSGATLPFGSVKGETAIPYRLVHFLILFHYQLVQTVSLARIKLATSLKAVAVSRDSVNFTTMAQVVVQA